MNKYIAYSANNALTALNIVGLNRTKLKLPTSNVDVEFYRRRIEKGLNNFRLIKKQLKQINSVLEFGTGIHGIDLMLLSLLGVKEIHTVDIDNHININWANHSEIFIEYLSEINEISYSDVNPEKVIAALKEVKNQKEFFDTINGMHYVFRDFLNIFNSRIDLWYSESNLQRIPLHSILKISEKAVENLSVGGLVFHRLDLADIYTQPHYPLYIPSLHRFDFLKYNDVVWHLINRDSYSSQNRLRLAQYHELFTTLGLSNVSREEVIYDNDIDYINSIQVAPCFKYLPPREIAIAHARVLYKKDDGMEGNSISFTETPGNW